MTRFKHSSLIERTKRSACALQLGARNGVWITRTPDVSSKRRTVGLYLERKVKPRRVDDATRITLVVLARCIDWRRLLTIVQPDTLVRWHRQGFRLFWRWKSRCRARSRIPVHLQELIATMARANRAWGEERIAAELLVTLGISVSSRDGQALHAEAGSISPEFVFTDVGHISAEPRRRNLGV